MELVDKTIHVADASFKMIYVDGGSFLMGVSSDTHNDGVQDDEMPSHNVALRSFFIGETVVTCRLWRAVMGGAIITDDADNMPMTGVSWANAMRFIKKLNSLTSLKFRLPTEAEWEFAAGGGIKNQGHMFSGSNNIEDVAWYGKNSEGTLHPVKY